MAPIAGKYVFEKDENLSDYFKAQDFSTRQLQILFGIFKDLEIKCSGNEYTIFSGLGDTSFPLEKEIDEKLFGAKLLKSTAFLSGNKLIIKSIRNDGKIQNRVYEASDNGLVLTLTSVVADRAKIYYKRV